jgi:CheY-like chemotaxis protein
MNSITVLLVDGDEQSLGLAAKNLEKEGFQVFRASDCQKALEILESKEIECIVTEYELPDKEGLEVCRGFRRRFSDIPLILFAEYRDEGFIHEAFENGADDYVSKDLENHKFSILGEKIRSKANNSESGFNSQLASELDINERDFLRKVIDVLPLGVAVRDAENHVVMANEYIGQEGEESLDKIVGEPLENTPLTKRTIEMIKKSDQKAIEKGRPIKTEEILEEENQERFIEATKIPFNAEEGENPHIAAVFRDITFRKRKEKSLEKVIETNKKMSRANTKERVWKVAAEAMSQIFDLPLSAALELENDVFKPVQANHNLKEEFGKVPSLEAKNSLAGKVFESGQSKLVEDSETLKEYNPETKIKAEVIIPVGDHGILMSGTKQERDFDQVDFYIADWFGSSVKASVDRVEREKMLSRRDEKLERQSQQIEQFVEMFSHDLRNPLNIAKGYLDMLEDGSDEIKEVEDALDRMGEIIQTLLEMAKHTGKLQKQELELEEMAEESWSHEYLDRASISIEEGRKLTANKQQFQYMLENLFSNSIKRSQAEISIEVGKTPDGFYMKDDGPKIPDKDKKRIFEFGYSSDHPGLSLAIVERIAGFQGWDVELNDSEEGGARFEFET